MAAPLVDTIFGLATLQRAYELASLDSDSFVEHALARLDIAVDLDTATLERIPVSGPLVVVANHPHGALDGLAVAAAVRRVRSDVKLLANSVLARVPELRPHLVPIESFSPGGANNTAGLRAAVDWLRAGHVLIVFPAGEVSHERTAGGRVVDGRWRHGAARLAAHADAAVLPLFVDGGNSRLFVAAGLVSPWLRTALLARELVRQRGRRISLRIGPAVSPRRLRSIGEAGARTAYLRVRTYGLAAPRAGQRVSWRIRVAANPAKSVPVVPPGDQAALAAEIAALPRSCTLVDSAPWRVYLVTAAQAPHALLEIGRQREIAFRAAGEGTHRGVDLDRFDRYYRHLFVWHAERRQIAGAYRLAATDDVLPRHGLRGLYTRSLFRYPAQLLRELGPALELGRSFVRPEFQRDYQPLLQLWRGIGAVVAAQPRYRTLFGPVSISAEYGPTTRQVLARCLLASRGSLLQPFVVPRRPLPDLLDGSEALVRSRVAASVRDVDALVRELESDHRGLPVLLRHYLKLNARLLGFSVDPAFGGVLDGLVVVDLLDVDRGLLERYLGKASAMRFLSAYEDPVGVPAVDAA